MTIATVKTKWETAIFADATIKGYTTNLYSYDLINTVSKSNAHEAKMFLANNLNFAQFIFLGRTRKEMTKDESQIYTVRVDYYKECDLSGTNFNSVVNFQEDLYSVVKTKLGNTWGGAVDFWNVVEEIPQVSSENLNGTPVWFSSQIYNANFI
jgi:hypothetical protein